MYQATGSFEQNVHYVSADVSEVDYQFATEPMTAVKPEEQVSEEELYRSFELALTPCSNRVSGSLTHQPYTTGDTEGLVPARGTRGTGIWSSLLSNPWQRGIILVSLGLSLLMSGFDLMGVLVLHMR
jgi:hypothetical protein